MLESYSLQFPTSTEGPQEHATKPQVDTLQARGDFLNTLKVEKHRRVAETLFAYENQPVSLPRLSEAASFHNACTARVAISEVRKRLHGFAIPLGVLHGIEGKQAYQLTTESRISFDVLREITWQEKVALETLMRTPGKVVPQERIGRALWGEDYEENSHYRALRDTTARMRKSVKSTIGIVTAAGRRGYVYDEVFTESSEWIQSLAVDEYALLRALVLKQDRTLSREEMMKAVLAVHGQSHEGTPSLKKISHTIASLNAKLLEANMGAVTQDMGVGANQGAKTILSLKLTSFTAKHVVPPELLPMEMPPTVADAESRAEPTTDPGFVLENEPAVSVEPEAPAEEPVAEVVPAAVEEEIRDELVPAPISDVIAVEQPAEQPAEPVQEPACEQVVSTDPPQLTKAPKKPATPPLIEPLDFDPEIHLDSDDFAELTVDEVMEELFAMDEMWEELELLETAESEGWLHWLDEEDPCPILEKRVDDLVRALGLHGEETSSDSLETRRNEEVSWLRLNPDDADEELLLEDESDFAEDEDLSEDDVSGSIEVRHKGGKSVIDTYDDVRLPRDLEAPDPDEEPMPFGLQRSKDDFEKTEALPGTEAKIEVLRARLQQGLPLYHEDDRLHYSEEE